MKKMTTHQIGIDAGEVILFSDFEDDGEMWAGTGSRMVRTPITFTESYAETPHVTVQLSMVDMSNEAYIRADLRAEKITRDGCEIVFRTWGDTRVARVRVAWQAIGPLANDDNWTL